MSFKWDDQGMVPLAGVLVDKSVYDSFTGHLGLAVMGARLEHVRDIKAGRAGTAPEVSLMLMVDPRAIERLGREGLSEDRVRFLLARAVHNLSRYIELNVALGVDVDWKREEEL